MATKKRFDVMYGEKYGDANDPKTSWKRAGTLFVDDETGRMSIKLDMIPVSKHFDGWLAVFEQRDRDPNSNAPVEGQDPVAPIDDDGDKPIDVSQIPF